MSDPSASRALMSRILFGVTSIGAALGLLYLYYSNRKKGNTTTDPDSNVSSTSTLLKSRKKRMSGERNRVTFAEENEIIGISSPTTSLTSKEDDEDVGKDSEAVHIRNEQVKPQALPDTALVKGESEQVPEKQRQTELEQTVKSSDIVQSEARELVPTEDAKPLVEKPAVAVVASSNSNGHNQNQSDAQQVVTPETDYDRTSMTRKLRISRDYVPGLIGRKGVNIRAIQQSSNTTMNFQDETLDNGDRVCVIRGQPQDVTVAESLIEKFILEQPIITTFTMYVPQSSVGRIIGKGGESIRAIQDLSKAKVNVDTSNHNHFHNRGGGDASVKMVPITIRGSEEQIDTAKQIIIEKVEEEKTLRKNIDIAAQNRTPRRPAGPTNPTTGSPMASTSINGNDQTLPLNKSGVLEVFVSCAYHPNDFWIQVMGRESIELDKLTESMTEWYSQQPYEELTLSIGEIIAAPFDVDGKMYRGKILKLEEEDAEVSYVDYGDRRIIKQTEVRRIHPEFLKLRFQALQATLNLGCIGDRWLDEAIVNFCDLTYCAQWQSLTAKVKDYLKGPGFTKETILWIELLDKELNIGNELIRRGLATGNDSLPTGTDSCASSSSRKSYASVVAEEQKPTLQAVDGTQVTQVHETGAGSWDDECNGN